MQEYEGQFKDKKVKSYTGEDIQFTINTQIDRPLKFIGLIKKCKWAFIDLPADMLCTMYEPCCLLSFHQAQSTKQATHDSFVYDQRQRNKQFTGAGVILPGIRFTQLC